MFREYLVVFFGLLAFAMPVFGATVKDAAPTTIFSTPTSNQVSYHEKKSHSALPSYFTLVSPIYYYKFTSKLNPPVLFDYQASTGVNYQRSVYYYNSTSQTWQAVTTTLTPDNHVQASLPFASAMIAVLDDTRTQLTPIKQTKFTNFGDIHAAAAIAIDNVTGKVLYSKNMNDVRSIASLTKEMTAYVLLTHNVNLQAVATYHDSYNREGGSLHVHEGETMTVENLLYAMIVGSANNAAITLSNQAGYNQTSFVQAMNDTAKQLGLTHTHFADPSGLAVENQSTAADYAKFLQYAWQNSELTKLSTAPLYRFSTSNTHKMHTIHNTDPLFRTSALHITGSKTGYINEALYCLALKAQSGSHQVITVVLGTPQFNERFSESQRLMQWALRNYTWGK